MSPYDAAAAAAAYGGHYGAAHTPSAQFSHNRKTAGSGSKNGGWHGLDMSSASATGGGTSSGVSSGSGGAPEMTSKSGQLLESLVLLFL